MHIAHTLYTLHCGLLLECLQIRFIVFDQIVVYSTHKKKFTF